MWLLEWWEPWSVVRVGVDLTGVDLVGEVVGVEWLPDLPGHQD